MSNAISGEFYFFLYAALTGAILSAIYDIFRILRRIYPHGTVFVALEDLVYWIGSALYISYILLFENSGIIRWFFVLGLLLGMLTYNLTLSRYLVLVFSKSIRFILHLVCKVLKFLFRPLTFLWNKNKKVNKKLKKTLKKYLKTFKIGICKK